MKSVEIIQSPETVSIKRAVRGLIVELRPKEWTKNLLVFSGLIFSRSLTDTHNIKISFFGFLIFCCASSGIYLFNDLCRHQRRPRTSDQAKSSARVGRVECQSGAFRNAALFAIAAFGALSLSYGFAGNHRNLSDDLRFLFAQIKRHRNSRRDSDRFGFCFAGDFRRGDYRCRSFRMARALHFDGRAARRFRQTPSRTRFARMRRQEIIAAV